MTQQTGSELKGAIKHMKKNGTFWVVIFGLVAGIILLIIGSGDFFGDKNRKNGATPGEDGEIRLSLSEYESIIENDISSLCGQVAGVDSVFVAVTLEKGVEYVYARNVQAASDGDERSEYVIIGSGSSAHALYLCEKPPEIGGIGVVCKCDNIEQVRYEIISLLSAAYDVPMNKIYVTQSDY